MSRADSLLSERRGMALVVARYIPGARTAVTLSMGALRHPLADFSRWDAVAAFSWAIYCTGIGVIGGSAFAEDPLPAVILGMAIALTIAGLAEVIRLVRRRRQLSTTTGYAGRSPTGAGPQPDLPDEALRRPTTAPAGDLEIRGNGVADPRPALLDSPLSPAIATTTPDRRRATHDGAMA